MGLTGLAKDIARPGGYLLLLLYEASLTAGVTKLFLEGQKNLILLSSARSAVKILEQCKKTKANTAIAEIQAILDDATLPLEMKAKYVEIKLETLVTESRRSRVFFMKYIPMIVGCLIALLVVLYIRNPTGFSILMSELLKAIKRGTIRKKTAQRIIIRLIKNGVPVDDEVMEAAGMIPVHA